MRGASVDVFLVLRVGVLCCFLSTFHVHSVRIPFLLQRPPRTWDTKPSLGPSIAPEPCPPYRGPIAAPYHKTLGRHHQHHRHARPSISLIPAAAPASGCDQTCLEPLTVTPMGSPCGCVLPIKVQLLLSMAVYAVFQEVNELEIEVAAGTYLKHSQVQIVGASADDQNTANTKVDINLVPLAEKFDNMTATLIVKKFIRKEVPLNKTLFGSYQVKDIYYPGTASTLEAKGYLGNSQTESARDHRRPISANVPDKNSRMMTKIMVIIVISALVLLFACSAAIPIFITWRKVRKASDDVGPASTPSINKKTGIGSTLSSCMASPTSMSFVPSMSACALSVKTFSLVELENATENFSPLRFLGEGGFGRVYRGTMEDGSEIAVKLLMKDNQRGDPEFVSEIEMLSRLHHRNLVKLLGFCIEGHRRCLVYELVPNGSVESHLHGADKEKKPLDWDARMKIALGSARGLAYLHEDSNPRVIHRDFKASNVLLGDDFTAKVSDFGLAREATEGSHNHVSTRVMGTFGYVAPEYAMTGHLLVKSDVYSYGVVLLELLTGRKPVDMSRPPGQENLVTWARPLLTTIEGLEQLLDPSLAGTCNFEAMAKVAGIASMCVHTEVTQRPFMSEVVQALKLIYDDNDETCADIGTQKDSSIHDLDSGSDARPYDSSGWSAGGLSLSPHLRYGQASPPFVTMEYSSDHLEDMDNRPFSAERVALPIRHGNRSGPLRTIRSKLSFYRLRGSMSEHGAPLSKRRLNMDFP